MERPQGYPHRSELLRAEANSGRAEKSLYHHACEETVVSLDAEGHRRAAHLGELPLAGQLDA